MQAIWSECSAFFYKMEKELIGFFFNSMASDIKLQKAGFMFDMWSQITLKLSKM